MYASNIIKFVSCCNRNNLLTRNFFGYSHFVYNRFANNYFCGNSQLKSQTLLNIKKPLSTTSSPDGNQNVSKDKSVKKRRRIISSDSSGDETPKPKAILDVEK